MYLTQLTSLFDSHRPQDMKQNDIVTEIKRLKAPTPEKLTEHFLSIRQKFKPVLRHYFTEKHKNPIHWFQMRLSYTRSVATTSIVGHILGLGDRHSSNILIDNVSGEVVHIDLGIAFDQVCSLPLALSPGSDKHVKSYQGKVTDYSGESSIPYDREYCRWYGSVWNNGCVPTVCRRNAPRLARRVRGHHDRTRSL